MLKKILVIEDNKMDRRLIKEYLTNAQVDCEIREAKNGEQGLAAIKKSRPDLIILDIVMGKLDGATLCGVLKSDKKYRSIPIIILTGLKAPVDRDVSHLVKADAHILKRDGLDLMVVKTKELLGL